MFKDYKKEGCIKGIDKQNNIMIFVGNGFDISVLKKYRKDGLVTSYGKFYDFLSYRGCDENNVLYKKMKDDKGKKENWSDFECSLGELLQNDISSDVLEEALREIQSKFLLFLNEIVTPEVLLKLNGDTEKEKWGQEALAKFLGDLDKEDYELSKFPSITQHYQMFNYLFVNFNYTSLFDNYIFFDRYQFEPHPYKTVDTNFIFYPNPKGCDENKINEKTSWSSFIMTDIIHPHGYQNIPRSLLFGIENKEYEANRELNRFNKSYWAQNNQKYKSYFQDVNLFIIYGTSIGRTDNWWWKNIFECLMKEECELIIYYFKDKDIKKEEVKQLFIDSSEIEEKNIDEEVINRVKKRIYVVLYDEESHNKMFSLRSEE